jgi:hypothetical protein
MENQARAVVAAAIVIMALVSAVAGVAQSPRRRATVVAFEKATGYPHGRPGYVVDHVIPLCAGGPDVAANLQWQTTAASYVKDGFERALCAAMKTQGYRLVRTP